MSQTAELLLTHEWSAEEAKIAIQLHLVRSLTIAYRLHIRTAVIDWDGVTADFTIRTRAGCCFTGRVTVLSHVVRIRVLLPDDLLDA